MSTLSEQERHGLEDVFLSISSSHPSILKDKAFHYHTHLMFHLKGQIRTLMRPSFIQKKLINTLKMTFLQKNLQKTEKTRKN
ncbi:MAG: hypothetical protein Q8R86_05240 [Sulfuricurvum sp.]|nr:hypothetical protein [Sulfuricurvum sp.]